MSDPPLPRGTPSPKTHIRHKRHGGDTSQIKPQSNGGDTADKNTGRLRHIGHKPHIDHNQKFMKTERTRAPFFFSLIAGLRFPPFPARRAFSLLCADDLDGIHPAHRECGQDAACRRNIEPTFAAHRRPQAVRIREHLPLGTRIFTQSVELAPRVCYHDVGLRINTGKE